jgi:16S rRNA processing protein RimM
VTLARILRPRGRRGEVAAELLTDFPARLTTLCEAYLWDGTSAPRRVAIRSCWLLKGQAVFHFEGCESISDAERLRGLQVQVPLENRMPLPAGHYYLTDLEGCELWEEALAGRWVKLGTVRGVQLTGEVTRGTPVLVVETSAGELLVPFAEEICRRIDTAARRIEVALPEGLRDLNRGT